MIFDTTIPPSGTLRDWIDFRADTTPDVISHIFLNDDSSITWSELRDAARDTAERLSGLGIPKGESVALCLPNGRHGILSLFGTLYGGFRATALNLAAGPAAMGYALSHSRAKWAFVDASQSDLFASANTDAKIIPVTDQIEWPTDTTAPLHSIDQTDHALLMYTSGTTGQPKGVVHSQASLLAGGWTTAVAHELTETDRAMCVLPFYHINGLCVTLIAPLISGGSVVVAQKFSNSAFWDKCDRHKITWFSIVPTIISHLLHAERNPSEAFKKRIRFGRSASAPLSPEIQSAFEDRFGVPIVETMGLTETAAQILSNPLPPGVRKIGSPGVACGNEAKILDGELLIKGPNVMQEYLFNEDATKDTFTDDGWLRTGDLGHMDDDGYVYITGRLKELIIKGGENIAPREIDEALYCHKDVVEAAAFPRDCKTYGQTVEAAVAITLDSTASEEDLLKLCQDRLGKFKCPNKIHFLTELPKGPSGKIQRAKLVEMLD